MPKASNPIADFILKKMQEKRPGDNLYRLSERTNINRATLYNMFYKYKNPWKSSIYLKVIADDLGLTQETLQFQKEMLQDLDKELKQWKDKAFKLESALKLANEKIDKQAAAIKELSK